MLMAEAGIPSALTLFGLVGFVLIRTAQRHWPQWQHSPVRPGLPAPPDWHFTYWLTFLGCSLFHLLDITLFDVRINLLNWAILAVIVGGLYEAEIVSCSDRPGSDSVSQATLDVAVKSNPD
jgi:hypothetical protein